MGTMQRNVIRKGGNDMPNQKYMSKKKVFDENPYQKTILKNGKKKKGKR